jgi:nucleoside-diphosphate-sugar epimerase
MRRCVVTGASGLIGSNLVERLRARWEVHALSRRPPPDGARRDVIWHEMDLNEKPDLHSLPGSVDALIYLAQSEHFREFPERAVDIFEVNTAALVRFLDYARRSGARTFIYGSSGGVYGSRSTGMREEISIPAEGNLGFYLGSKLCSEIVALNFAKLMSVVILRFFFVYGSGQRRKMLIPRLIDAVRAGEPVTLQGKQGIRINPVHVSDAANAIVRSLQLKGTHKINVAGPEILSLREICETIGRAVDRRPVYKVEKTAPRHIIGDITKMRDLLFSPRIPLRKGLSSLVEAK